MSAELDRDLGAWARDELSRERLLAAHGTAAAAIVGVHDRLTTAAAALSVPAAEPGWAALLAQIDAPAPVIPLHPPRVRRIVSIAVAAAIAFAGIAYAASSRGSNDGAPTVSPAPSAPAALGPTTPGAGSNDRRSVHAPAPRAGSPSVGGPSGADSPSPHERGTSTRGVDGGGGGVKPGDDPHDRDQGTGNDGPHNDHGSGNNGPEGSRPPNSHGH
jgi:translation initiation factor IF-2